MQALSLVVVSRRLTAPASGRAWTRGSGRAGWVVTAPGLWGPDLVAMALKFSGPVARGVFPDQGSNPRLLHWQVDSYH